MNQQENIKILAEKVIRADGIPKFDWGAGVVRQWNPYENIQDAWDLVDKIKSMSDKIRIRLEFEDNWYFQFYDRPEYKVGESDGVGETPQEAICEACLEWVKCGS